MKYLRIGGERKMSKIFKMAELKVAKFFHKSQNNWVKFILCLYNQDVKKLRVDWLKKKFNAERAWTSIAHKNVQSNLSLASL